MSFEVEYIFLRGNIKIFCIKLFFSIIFGRITSARSLYEKFKQKRTFISRKIQKKGTFITQKFPTLILKSVGVMGQHNHVIMICG